MLKSDETLFKKYVAQSVENVAEILDVSVEEETIDLINNSDYEEELEADVQYLESENDEQEIYNIEETGIIKNSENNQYRNLEIYYEEEELLAIDLLQQDETYGLRLANLVQQFVSVENSTLSYFISSLGYDGTYFDENLQKVDISGLLDFSDEEIETLISTYSDVIFTDLNSSNFSSKSNAMITLNNGNSVTTKSYSLTISQNDLDKVYKRILNQAIQDEIILSKLEQIDSKIQEFGINLKEEEKLKELYITKLQEIIDSIEYEGTDTRQTVFTVYVENGTTVRTSMKTESYEYNLDLDNTNGKTLSFKNTTLTDEGTDEKTYSLGKNETQNNITRVFSYEDEEENLSISVNYNIQDTGINSTSSFEYSNSNITKLNGEVAYNIIYGTNEEIKIEFNDTNNILLNDYEGSRVMSILDNLKKRAITSLENSQAKINTKMLNNILLYIDEIEQEKEEEEQNNIETQKRRFNNQFVLYEGDEVEYEYMIKLLKTIGQNMSGYEVISGSRIKIYIEDGTENEEMAEEIAAAINEKNTYTVELSYNDDGYVESIDITINSK